MYTTVKKSGTQGLTNKEVRNRYDSFVLQGNVKMGFDYLSQLEGNSKATKLFQDKVNRRFFKKNPHIVIKTKDPWVRKVLRCYHLYWISVLSQLSERTVAEQKLCKELALLCSELDNTAGWEEITTSLERHFKDRGLYFLGGITCPFHSCYLYGSRRRRVYTVNLPHKRKVEVPVYFLGKFISYDWQGFGTFGRSRTGGWATSDALFCIEKGYDLDSEHFKVSYLKHEGQHFDDYHRFKALGPDSTDEDYPAGVNGNLWKSSTLEFRAKLVELLNLSDYTFLERTITTASDNPAIPHAYSANLIITGLIKLLKTPCHIKLTALPLREIKEAAIELFDQNTAELKKLEKRNESMEV